MIILLRSGAVAFLLASLALPVTVSAEEAQNFAKDAGNAESTPPMIPHLFKDTSDGRYCLGCHETGVKDAPVTPHPERLSCTGCHGQGEIKAANPVKKGTN
jgi:cytochrome c-type protein NapB